MRILVYLKKIKDYLISKKTKFRKTLFGLCKGCYLPLNLSFQLRCYLGIYELEIEKYLKSYIKPGFCCFDIGASIGYYTIALARLSSPGKIYSFEANKKYCDLLNETVEMNKKLKSIINILNNFIGNSINQDKLETTIDHLIYKKNIPKPDFIKMDIEGAEYEAFLGAEKILKEFHPNIIVEVHSDKLRDNCKDLLEKYGYLVHVINQNQILPIREGAYNGWLCCEKK